MTTSTAIPCQTCLAHRQTLADRGQTGVPEYESYADSRLEVNPTLYLILSGFDGVTVGANVAGIGTDDMSITCDHSGHELNEDEHPELAKAIRKAVSRLEDYLLATGT